MKCFVIMPFGDTRADGERARRLTHIYDKWIKPTVESVEDSDGRPCMIECVRADREPRSGEIIMHIIENLLTAEIVVADLSGRNPNVFYELGVRHAIGKPTVLIADNIEDIPFDLRGLRTIRYEYDPEKLVEFRDALSVALRAMVSQGAGIDNPVSQFLLNKEVERIRHADTPPGYDVLRNVLTEMDTLKKVLASQVGEMKQVAQAITASSQKELSRMIEGLADLGMLEGLWRATPTRSLVCLRILNGRLFAPYSYDEGNSHLTGHYFSFRRVGDVVFARFEWFFAGDVAGFGVYKIVSPNKLAGGWWLDRDVPELSRDSELLITGTVRNMVPTTLLKEETTSVPLLLK